ncbi:MAG: hypothetical protein V1821_00080 [bacterium]
MPIDTAALEDVPNPEQVPEEKPIKIDLESPEVSEEQKVTYSKEALKAWGKVLKNIPEATIFASSAMFLWGEKLPPETLRDPAVAEVFGKPPGDMDLVVPNIQALDRAREVLNNIPSVKFDNDGRYKVLADGTHRLSGKVKIMVEPGKFIEQEFELFDADKNRLFKTDIIKSRQKIETSEGEFNVLTLEGLTAQYSNNFYLESKIREESEKVFAELDQADPNERKHLRKRGALGLDGEAITKYYRYLNQYQLLENQKTPEAEKQRGRLHEIMTKIVTGGLKEKVEKRLANLKALYEAKKIAI